MKCTIPEISWHNRDPILSVDIQPMQTNKNLYRLASGGTDTHVLIWQLTILKNGGVSVEMLTDLTRHTRSVNAVRFSPNGQILASADDDSAIILWKKTEDSSDIFIDENEKENKEHWNVLKMLRNHLNDVYDLCWSKCSQFLVSGAVDSTAILWDVHKGVSKSILQDHNGFVQGVAWDPKGQFVATLSSDRNMRIFNITSDKIKLINRVYKSVLPSTSPEESEKQTTRLFYDDTLKSFCRRLAFSPDGEFLVAPSGIIEDAGGKYTNVSHLFIRSCLNRPVMCFPTQDKYTIAVRFCPILFELRKLKQSESCENPPYTQLFNLPYRLVFAVATQNAVLIYDTQQPIPFGKVSNIHYTRLSDVSWSSDGRILVASSSDGYCSLISFGEGELGTPYYSTEVTPDSKGVSESSPDSKKVGDSCKNSPNVDEKMDVDDGEGCQNENVSPNKGLKKDVKEQSGLRRNEKKSPSVKVATPIAVKRKSGKRIEIITLSKNVNEKKSEVISPIAREDTSKKSVEDEEKVTDLLNKTVDGNEHKDSTTEENKNTSVQIEENKNTIVQAAESDLPSIPLPKTPRRVPLITLSSPKNKNLKSS